MAARKILVEHSEMQKKLVVIAQKLLEFLHRIARNFHFKEIVKMPPPGRLIVQKVEKSVKMPRGGAFSRVKMPGGHFHDLRFESKNRKIENFGKKILPPLYRCFPVKIRYFGAPRWDWEARVAKSRFLEVIFPFKRSIFPTFSLWP